MEVNIYMIIVGSIIDIDESKEIEEIVKISTIGKRMEIVKISTIGKRIRSLSHEVKID